MLLSLPDTWNYSVRGLFFAENICRDVLAEDEFYFEQRPILGRGRNCAATWDDAVEGRTFWVKSDFIPEYEFPGVSAALKGFDKFFFSMRFMSNTKNKAGIFERLNVLADSYEKWIHEKLISDDKMSNADFKEKIGDKVISHCSEALNRIREGIELIANDEVAFDALFLGGILQQYSRTWRCSTLVTRRHSETNL